MSTPQESLDEITVTAVRPIPTTQTGVRHPRGAVRINGKVVGGWLSWSVSNNSYLEADTYRVVFAASALLEFTDVAWFSNETETFVEILGGIPDLDDDSPDANQFTSFIYGRIDDMEFDPVEQTLTLTGRDLTGVFIDAKISMDYANQKASDIAQALATKHGLEYQITPTKTNVGNYYDLDVMQLQAGRSEWDLLTYLARHEGFVVYVTQEILYFGPDKSGTGNPFYLDYKEVPNAGGSPITNVLNMTFSRSQTIVKGITVTVRAAGRYNPASLSRSYPSAPKAIAAGKASPYGATTDYYYNMPAGTTSFELIKRAQEIYTRIASQAMKLKFTVPADELTTPQSKIIVNGTNTAFDQTYFPVVVTRTLSVEEGFIMEIEAQNLSPNLTPADTPAPAAAPAQTDDDSGGTDE